MQKYYNDIFFIFHPNINVKIICYKKQLLIFKQAFCFTFKGTSFGTLKKALTDSFLQNRFALLFIYLEPHEIADEMFQRGHISVAEHTAISDIKKRYKRLQELLSILQKYHLYEAFVDVLEFLGFSEFLLTLDKDKSLNVEQCKSLFCLNTE